MDQHWSGLDSEQLHSAEEEERTIEHCLLPSLPDEVNLVLFMASLVILLHTLLVLLSYYTQY